MPSRILEKIKERVEQLNEQPPKPNTKEQQLSFGILKSSETNLAKTKGNKPKQGLDEPKKKQNR